MWQYISYFILFLMWKVMNRIMKIPGFTWCDLKKKQPTFSHKGNINSYNNFNVENRYREWGLTYFLHFPFTSGMEHHWTGIAICSLVSEPATRPQGYILRFDWKHTTYLIWETYHISKLKIPIVAVTCYFHWACWVWFQWGSNWS